MAPYRDCPIADITKDMAGKQVHLAGWIHRIRDLKERYFITLRDRSAMVQLYVEKNKDPGVTATARGLRSEFVVSVSGIVRSRPEDMVKNEQQKGAIEIEVTGIEVLNTCPVLPFEVSRGEAVAEHLALKYRYLELRKPEALAKLALRHQVVLYIRNFLSQRGFMEIETPLLTRSTPEGARDFVVPSRRFPGQFYALPQSPQQYKELLMIAGVDRYFQIARCLRDEDARADRQIEHTQVDFEMSFVVEEDVLSLLEEMISGITRKLTDKKLLDSPFKRLTYRRAMEEYGSDKPDLRFALTLKDVGDSVMALPIPFLAQARENTGDFAVKGLVIPGQGNASRRVLDAYKKKVLLYKAQGFMHVALRQGQVKSSLAKFADPGQLRHIVHDLGGGDGDLLVMAFGERRCVNLALGALRQQVGRDLGLADANTLAFAFVHAFPLFEQGDDGKLEPLHHMFVMPKAEDIPLLDTDPLAVTGTQYDLVCNGYELCSGSLRIHDPSLQRKIMGLIGLDAQTQEQQFGHLLEALSFGAPPHGGAAPGLDRLIMVLAGTEKMRDVLAFPKTTEGRDLLMDAPAPIHAGQLQELHLDIVRD